MDFENQQMVEQIFNARQTPRLLRKELLGSAEVVARVQASELDQEFALDLLAQMILCKRATVPQLVGQLRHHFARMANPFQACADALLTAAERDLVDYDPERQQFILVFDLDEATHALLRQYQYLPPMLVPPLEVTDNRGSGYLTIRTDSLLLKDNHHEGDLCLDHLNRCNRIAFSVNTEVVRTIRNQWKHLDKPKDGESFQDYQQRLKAFERYERDSFFTIALMQEMGNRFYLTHKYDKRGRTYCQGYHITYQGNQWNKAVIEFATPTLITDEILE